MAFHNDIGLTEVFQKFYTQIMGSEKPLFSELEFSYTIGIAAGILVFFNHFGKKKFTVDPTPMEVEMRLYENDIQTTLLETYSRKEKELDVGTKHSSGVHRS